MLLGVDTGGTFTDFVFFDGNTLLTHKVLSTPDAPERAILQGIEELCLKGKDFYLVHGSTIATNAVLEGKGVKTAYVTNHGLGDVLTIGRQARRELYNLQPPPRDPPVPPELCIETGGRLGANGDVVEPLSQQQCCQVAEELTRLGPQAVAINLLFSFLDGSFEHQLAAALPDTLFVSCSCDVLPQEREYERGIATWLNAWVGPLVEGYLERLQDQVQPSPVHVMQSSALTIRADQAASKAVKLLLSGPAGGLTGALHMGEAVGRRQLLSFDMGGTSTDVALLDGRVNLTLDGRIGDYPVAVPMVDMHTIGAGGGSIARLDKGGMLEVGPESAGAVPGPACYAQGGKEATVTDANLVLGRLRQAAFLGGKMQLDYAAASKAVGYLATQMDMSPERAALGIVELANQHMAQALRVISVQRGIDPRDFTLVAFGGAGGLHVCALAAALQMTRVLVPMHAGVLSALGMLAAPRGRELSHTVRGLLSGQQEDSLQEQFDRLSATGITELQEEGVDPRGVEVTCSADLRYQGQSNALNIRYRCLSQAEADFHTAHHKRFGHRLDSPVELVNLRVSLAASAQTFDASDKPQGGSNQPLETASLYAVESPVEVWRRADLEAEKDYTGPVLIVDTVATTFVAPGWRARRHVSGGLLLDR